jgi:hypothetical protein
VIGGHRGDCNADGPEQKRQRGPSSLRSLGMPRKGKGEARSKATERSLVASSLPPSPSAFAKATAD